jgi:hypothetical protein
LIHVRWAFVGDRFNVLGSSSRPGIPPPGRSRSKPHAGILGVLGVLGVLGAFGAFGGFGAFGVFGVLGVFGVFGGPILCLLCPLWIKIEAWRTPTCWTT